MPSMKVFCARKKSRIAGRTTRVLAAIKRCPHWKGFEEVEALRSAHSRGCIQVGRSTCETPDAQPPAITSTEVRQRRRLRQK
jgi:hypothetical protein